MSMYLHNKSDSVCEKSLTCHVTHNTDVKQVIHITQTWSIRGIA